LLLVTLTAFGASCRTTALRNETDTDGTPVRVEIAEEQQPSVDDPAVLQRLDGYRAEQAASTDKGEADPDATDSGDESEHEEEEDTVPPQVLAERMRLYVAGRAGAGPFIDPEAEEAAEASLTLPATFDPFIERNCPPEGSAVGDHHQDLNRLKNRSTKPKATDIDSSATFDSLRAPSPDDSDRWSTGVAATIVGYVRTAKATGAETCNCKANTVRLKDTHLDIVSGPGDTGLPVIAEITPVWRLIRENKNLGSWSSSTIRSKYEGHKVRITGWLFFDDIHKSGAANSDPNDTKGEANWRATCWEIHPITSISLAD
jgi:hypothetical protein